MFVRSESGKYQIWAKSQMKTTQGQWFQVYSTTLTLNAAVRYMRLDTYYEMEIRAV